jgi:hypothetical protein
LLYYLDTSSNEWYDYGMKIPTDFSEPSTEDGRADVFHKSVFYARKFNATAIEPIPTYNTDDESWDCLFSVDAHGNIYENGVALSDKYMLRDGDKPDFSGVLTINNQTYNGTTNVTIGTLGVAYGGTGQTSALDAANSFLNSLPTGWTANITDTTNLVRQDTGGGPSFGRIPFLHVWNYINSKFKSTYTDPNNYRTLTNNTFDSITVTDLSAGNIVATGAIRATNGIYGNVTGNLTGTASEATHAASATTATKATQDGNGANIASTYLKLAGGTMTGELYLKKSGINA